MVFRAATISEGWGDSVRSIIRTCREYDFPEPQMENSGIDFNVTIYRPGFGGMSVPSSQSGDIRRNILSSIESDPGITVSDLSSLLGIPQRTVERYIIPET